MRRIALVSLLLGIFLSTGFAADVVPATIEQPGTQPQEVSNLESPDKCDNCHGGYNTAVEPAFNWRGSMMANAGRDPIFWATLAMAEQDFDGVGDLCIRCHSTAGWLAGRSTPTDGSGLAAGDDDGVECDFCHKMTNPDNSDPVLQGVMNTPFVANEPDPDPDPDSNGLLGYFGSGMASIWSGADKLGPYSDATARHQFMKNAFVRSVDFCGTCHDVSNPAVGTLAHNYGAQPEFLATETVIVIPDPPTEDRGEVAFNNFPYKYGVVERTFSEYKAGAMSETLVDDYPGLPADLQGGALKAIYEAATDFGTRSANYEDGEDRFYSCQSCHMRPVFGQGCNKNPPFRNDLPLHDMTGGNYWMPEAIKYLDGLGQLRLGGGLSATQIAALDAGALRAIEQLNLAATLTVNNNAHTVKIVNHTGHKLITGYPEGRRMWLNIKWFDDSNSLLREDGAYGGIEVDDPRSTAVAKPKISVDSILDLDDPNTKIYEAHYGLDQAWAERLIDLGYPDWLALGYDRVTYNTVHTLGDLASAAAGTAYESFHFALNNVVIHDNRIPPYGMDYETARLRNALPVPTDQYGGGPGKTYDYFDTVALNPPQGAKSATIDLLYQPTSWEYIQFLYLANSLPDGSFLGMEDDYMLDAWLHNGMAEPYIMASATWRDPTTCTAPTPTLNAATPGNGQVSLDWSEEPAVDGYNVYYDQAGKAQLVASVGTVTSFTDSDLTNGQEYCYKVTSATAGCESPFSNIVCAIPNSQGQARVGATLMTGRYETAGKGKKAVTTFVETAAFSAGDAITVRATVLDQATGLPVPNAVVSIAIGGPETVALDTGPSDAEGLAEATWQTTEPNKRGQGGATPGSYTAATTNVDANGYAWDGVGSSTIFEIQ